MVYIYIASNSLSFLTSGGHVECLEAGVFRQDLPVHFHPTPSALTSLLSHLDRDLTFAIENELGLSRAMVTNYDEVKQAIAEKLEMLRDSAKRGGVYEAPLIYHLDVGAMYPNIILTNRLQPSSMVTPKDCAACKFNQVGTCTPFTIHHTPYTIHHTPYTIHHTPYT
ncbi:hypothetical protein EON63_03680, partial [archaeon]